MKLVFVLYCFLAFPSYGQCVSGNYLMVNNWSISHIQLKKNNTVKWYTSGCTDQGTDSIGTWSLNRDTVRITLGTKTTTFILKNKTLCHLDDDGTLTQVEYGIPKTIIRSKWRIHDKARRQRRRK